MISTRHINSATAPLRQAYELAIQIEAMDSFAPDALVDTHKRQFQFQMEQVAAKLGFALVTLWPPPSIAVNNEVLKGVDITCPR